MDEKKLLNGMELHDEELDKVAGGSLHWTTDGRLKINWPEEYSCCDMKYFKGLLDGLTGKDAILSGYFRCSECAYRTSDSYCTNPDVAASFKG